MILIYTSEAIFQTAGSLSMKTKRGCTNSILTGAVDAISADKLLPMLESYSESCRFCPSAHADCESRRQRVPRVLITIGRALPAGKLARLPKTHLAHQPSVPSANRGIIGKRFQHPAQHQQPSIGTRGHSHWDSGQPDPASHR